MAVELSPGLPCSFKDIVLLNHGDQRLVRVSAWRALHGFPSPWGFELLYGKDLAQNLACEVLHTSQLLSGLSFFL